MYNLVVFAGVNLPSIDGVTITDVTVDRMPEVIISKGDIARSDGVKIYDKRYGAKPVNIRGYIATTSRGAYIAVRDEILKSTRSMNDTLRVTIDGTVIEYTATVANIIFSNTGGGYGEFDIEFTASIGRDRTNRTILDAYGVTGSTSPMTLVESIGGSYLAPVELTVNVISVTGGTGAYIQLSNQAGDIIKVTRDWANDDVWTINTELYTCKVNGADTDFDGSFWMVDIDDTQISYDDSLTTRSVTVSATYKRRYL